MIRMVTDIEGVGVMTREDEEEDSMARSATEDLITRRDAAEMAGVHINTVRLWEQTGRVNTSKAENGVVLIPRAEVEGIMEQRAASHMDADSKNAALEAENRMLREELGVVREQYSRLLDRVITLAGGQSEQR